MNYYVREIGSVEKGYKTLYSFDGDTLGEADLHCMKPGVWLFSRLCVNGAMRGALGSVLVKEAIAYCNDNYLCLLCGDEINDETALPEGKGISQALALSKPH